MKRRAPRNIKKEDRREELREYSKKIGGRIK